MNFATTNWLCWALLCVPASLYTVAFFLPAASLPGRMGPIRVEDRVFAEGGMPLPPLKLKGYQAFDFAWKFKRADWFANPLLWIGAVLLACRYWLLCGVAGTVALVLGALSMLVYDASEPDLKTTFLIGYWLWLASMFSMAVIGWAGWLLSKCARTRGRRSVNPAE